MEKITTKTSNADKKLIEYYAKLQRANKTK
jgi:hypothetical protein